MDSILDTIKTMLAVEISDTAFDIEITTLINAVFLDLTQNGIGPSDGFVISSSTETWTDFIGEDAKLLVGVKTYIFLKVKSLFDPPASNVLEHFNRYTDLLLSRMSITIPVTDDEDDGDGDEEV